MLLLPENYRVKGLLAALTGLFGYAVATTEGLINVYRVILPNRVFPDGSYPYPDDFWAINSVFETASVCLVGLGIIAIFVARERDEFFYKIRLESIQFAMYAQFAVSLSAFAYFYFTPGYQLINTFVPILGMGLGSFIVAYLLRYYYSAHFQANLN